VVTRIATTAAKFVLPTVYPLERIPCLDSDKSPPVEFVVVALLLEGLVMLLGDSLIDGACVDDGSDTGSTVGDEGLALLDLEVGDEGLAFGDLEGPGTGRAIDEGWALGAWWDMGGSCTCTAGATGGLAIGDFVMARADLLL
jgi:hypothetical protein